MSFFQLAFWHAATHNLPLPFTEYLIGGHTHIFILTPSLQGRNNFPILLEKTEPPGGQVAQIHWCSFH